MTLYCSVDIETTGLDAEHCDVIEIAAVIDHTLKPYSDEERPEYHCYVKEDLYTGEPYALGLHADIFKRIAKSEKPHRYFLKQEAIYNFGIWLIDNWKSATESQSVLFAGKNFASFDLPFLKKMPSFNETITYQHGVLDPGPLYLDPKKDVRVPDTKTCCERAGIEYHDGHTALEDALQVSKLLQAYYAKKTHKGWIWPRKRS